MRRLTRRVFLGTASATAAAVGVGAWRRSVRADDSAVQVPRVLIVNAPGGLRSSAAFHAKPGQNLNPWGIDGTYGALTLGNVMSGGTGDITFDAPSWPTPTIPSLPEIGEQMALIGATDHAPDGSHRDGDHGDDTERMGTGFFGKADAPGLLSVINRAVGTEADAPVVTIGGGRFGRAPGDWLAHAPIQLVYYQMPDEPPNSGHPDVGEAVETMLDQRFTERRRAQGRVHLDTYRGTKDVMRKFGPLLADPALDMTGNPDAEVDGITNQMLVEVGGTQQQTDVRSIALALRLLQVGSPAVSLSLERFDWHDDEDTQAPIRYPRFARYLAGIHFALANMPDPSGEGTLLDNTLVLTTSEFGRTAAPGGFNEGGGTDHGDGPGWRYQAHVAFGGGVVPKLIAPTDDVGEPTDGIVSTHALLATVACAVGAPLEMVEDVWPSGTGLYPEEEPLWVLWE